MIALFTPTSIPNNSGINYIGEIRGFVVYMLVPVALGFLTARLGMAFVRQNKDNRLSPTSVSLMAGMILPFPALVLFMFKQSTGTWEAVLIDLFYAAFIMAPILLLVGPLLLIYASIKKPDNRDCILRFVFSVSQPHR
jgi:hypothetical protein